MYISEDKRIEEFAEKYDPELDDFDNNKEKSALKRTLKSFPPLNGQKNSRTTQVGIYQAKHLYCYCLLSFISPLRHSVPMRQKNKHRFYNTIRIIITVLIWSE